MDERETTATIDRALERGSVAAAAGSLERELEELTLALAADAPEAAPTFEATLGERVGQGFPSTARAAHGRLGLRRLPTPLLAGTASLVAVVAVVAALGANDSPNGAGGGATSISSAPSDRLDAPALDSSGAQEDSAGAGARSGRPVGKAQRALLAPDGGTTLHRFARPRRGFAPGVRDRRIERSATLGLAAPSDKLDRVAADVASVTQRYGGFVLSSSLVTGDEGVTTGGSFELRIPAARLDRALADLAELGQVRSRTQEGDDVTSAFVTTGDRLEAARAERRGLLTRLESADTDVEIEALRFQLDANAGEINRLLGRIRALRQRTNYATVSVTLESRDEDSAAPGDGLGGAVDDALDTLGDSLELAIRILGVLVPLGLVAAIAAIAARALRRRRREAALS